MNFDEKIVGGNKIENLLIILEAKLRLYVSIYYLSLRWKYPPPKSSFIDDGTLPEQMFFGCTPLKLGCLSPPIYLTMKDVGR